MKLCLIRRRFELLMDEQAIEMLCIVFLMPSSLLFSPRAKIVAIDRFGAAFRLGLSFE